MAKCHRSPQVGAVKNAAARAHASAGQHGQFAPPGICAKAGEFGHQRQGNAGDGQQHAAAQTGADGLAAQRGGQQHRQQREQAEDQRGLRGADVLQAKVEQCDQQRELAQAQGCHGGQIRKSYVFSSYPCNIVKGYRHKKPMA